MSFNKHNFFCKTGDYIFNTDRGLIQDMAERIGRSGQCGHVFSHGLAE